MKSIMEEREWDEPTEPYGYTDRAVYKYDNDELEFGDECLKSDGSDSFISTVETLEEKHTVYNLLSVSENHNFFANGILVHNK